MQALLFALLMLFVTADQPGTMRTTSGEVVPDSAAFAAEDFFDMLLDVCPKDPEFCLRNYEFNYFEGLQRAYLEDPWVAVVLTFDDFRKTPFQDLMRTARFNYYAFPIVLKSEFMGLIKICDDPRGSRRNWFNCGVRGPSRIAELNTYNLTLAPSSDSLTVVCVLTVENNSRYIIVRKPAGIFAIPASDVACQLMQVNVRHVSRMTMFPLADTMYKIVQTIQQRDRFKQ
jgi:hypothetical protein